MQLFCSFEPEAGIAPKTAAREFPQGSASNLPEMWLVGMPEKEALNAKAISPKGFGGTYGALQKLSRRTPGEKRCSWVWSLVESLKEFGSGLRPVSSSVLGNNLGTFIRPGNVQGPGFMVKPARETCCWLGQRAIKALWFSISIQKERGRLEDPTVLYARIFVTYRVWHQKTRNNLNIR